MTRGAAAGPVRARPLPPVRSLCDSHARTKPRSRAARGRNLRGGAGEWGSSRSDAPLGCCVIGRSSRCATAGACPARP
eukprot:scaffold117917_cov75-Phaeocystis_antarctica.AAC.1